MNEHFPTNEEFLDALPVEIARVPALVDLQESDFALTRFVRANCLVTNDTPTPLVVKGGFAVRHIYGGTRFSKDADMVLRSPDLGFNGAEHDLLALPPGMEIAQKLLSKVEKSWIITLRYVRTDKKMASKNLQCDLNTRERALQLPPPRKEHFSSYHFAPFQVWAASPEEIVAEKLSALFEKQVGRIRDTFDVCTVLATDPQPWDGAIARRLLGELLEAKRIPPLADPREAVAGIAKLPGSAAAWDDQVVSITPRPVKPLADVADELVDLLGDFGLGR